MNNYEKYNLEEQVRNLKKRLDNALQMISTKEGEVLKLKEENERFDNNINLLRGIREKLTEENNRLKQDLESYKEHDETLIKLVSTHTMITIKEEQELKQVKQRAEDYYKLICELAQTECRKITEDDETKYCDCLYCVHGGIMRKILKDEK